MPGKLPKTGELTIGQRSARQPGKTKRGRLNARNAVNAKEAYMRCFDGGIGHDEWIRTQRCACCEPGTQRTPTQAAHWVARGMGAAKGKWYDLVPLCKVHHDEHGANGDDYMRHNYGGFLVGRAAGLAEQHLRELGAIR